jgi:hypothetical protein
MKIINFGLKDHGLRLTSTCDQIATIRLSFMEGIDRKNNTKAKFCSLSACPDTRQGNLLAHGRGGWGVAARLIDCLQSGRWLSRSINLTIAF